MKKLSSARSFALAAAIAAGSLAIAAPAAADVQSFTGCLDREEEGVRFYRLDDARRDGEKIGDVRLTGSLSGLDPEKALGRKVEVRGEFDPSSGEGDVQDISVQSASLLGGDCA